MNSGRLLRNPVLAVLAALLLIVLAGLASGARPTASDRGGAGTSQPNGGASEASQTDSEETGRGGPLAQPAPGKLPLSRSAVVIGLVVAIALLVRGGFPVPPEDTVPDPSVAPEPLPSGRVGPLDQESLRQDALTTMEEALVLLGDEGDPGRAVRLAYAELSAGFGRAALRRGAAESEVEYLARMLSQVGGSGPAISRLTDLFSVARFSTEPVTEAMRGEARTALGEIRDVLGAGDGRGRTTPP